MPKLRDSTNEQGVGVSVFECEFCGDVFTVCPIVPDEHLDGWQGCLAESCDSYDPMRDIDALLFFGVPVERVKRPFDTK